MTTAVALLAVVLTGAVAWYMIRDGAEARQRDQLGRQAEVLSRTPVFSQLLLDREQRLAGSNGVRLAVVGPAGEAAGPAAAAVAARTRAALLDGESVSTEGRLDGEQVLVEGRPGDGHTAVVLTQPYTVVGDSISRVRGALILPLAVGLAGAALGGLLLARRLSRPLTTAATTARRLAEGGRGLRAEQGGPRELADLRGALHARYQGIRPSGTGLGLAIVHRLAQRLGGSVTAQGHGPEGGACFSVRLSRRP
ncbi:HAMP domain-containing protein [Streptomyces sp. SLBN-118]|uniref:ATP-binding protein n=1 Tax=Streptomyces sp. SLBN-118 TaxID=2768454 RepID=UPI001150239F|nr:ATP-binding protein [Streptomyces sp. SLBN-118]TQK50385.1 HAMP domain-containing protein [Streptomyces sp. SLBN-118]